MSTISTVDLLTWGRLLNRPVDRNFRIIVGTKLRALATALENAAEEQKKHAFAKLERNAVADADYAPRPDYDRFGAIIYQ